MSNRKPVELKPLLLLYNASVAGLNLYIGLELFLTSHFAFMRRPMTRHDDRMIAQCRGFAPSESTALTFALALIAS